MSMHLVAFTSAQMLIVGVLVFLLLAGIAFWFYSQASGSEEPAPKARAKPSPAVQKTFIPVVRPPVSRPKVARAEPPSPSAGSGIPSVAEKSSQVGLAAPADSPRVTGLIATQVLPTDIEVAADIRTAEDGSPVLSVRCRGKFSGVSVGGLFFIVDFCLAGHESAQLRLCPRPGAGWMPLRFRQLYDRPLASDEWLELGAASLRDVAGPYSGTHLVRVTCSAYSCDVGIELAEATPDSNACCVAATGLSVPFVGLGHEDVAVWLGRREKFIGVVAGCASAGGDPRETHRSLIAEWIQEQCDSLDAHPEFRRSCFARLEAVLESTHFGMGCTAVACHELVGSPGLHDDLLGSFARILASFGSFTDLSIYELERIAKACLWLGLPCPEVVEQAIARATSVQAPVTVAPPAPTDPGPRRAGFPFTVTLSLIGGIQAPEGFQVMVSGDLPVRTSATQDLYFSVSAADADLRASWPFLVSARDVDGLSELTCPSLTVARDQYDPGSPRKIAEILFKDCAFPRNGERTLQVSCVGYSVDDKGGLTRLCAGDASGTVKIPGTGYLALRKRRRTLRGLALELALALGTAGSVSLAQKTIAKDWIASQSSSIADPDERRLTVNHLTKILLGAGAMSQAELVALAIRLAGHRQQRFSQDSVALAETLADAKPSAKSRLAPLFAKIRKELGLPARSTPTKPVTPRVPAAPSVDATVPKDAVRPVRTKLNPRQVKARSLNRKLGRTVSGWKSMSDLRKIEHLRGEILTKSARMPACKGLADRNMLQDEITDMSELVVMLRSGKGLA